MSTHHRPDTELLVLGGNDQDAVMAQARALGQRAKDVAPSILAADCAERIDPQARIRAALVVRDPADLHRHLGLLEEAARRPFAEVAFHPGHTVWWSAVAPGRARVGFTFPGNGVQRLDMGRALVDAFPWARHMLNQAKAVLHELDAPDFSAPLFRPFHPLDEDEERHWFERLSGLEIAAPAIIFTDAIWARYLDVIGLRPVATCGHSQGEQAAWYSAGAIDFRELMQLAVYMSRAGSPEYNPGVEGRMVVVRAATPVVRALIEQAGGYLVVAAINGPAEVTVAGEADAIANLQRVAMAKDLDVRALPIFGGLHSKLVEAGVSYMRTHGPDLGPVGPTAAEIISGLNGESVGPQVRPLEYFCEMGLNTVDFERTAKALSGRIDLMLEVGPGRGLSGFVQSIDPGFVCLPLEPKPMHTRALHVAGAALWAHGAALKWDVFFKTVRRAWGAGAPAV